MAGRQRISIDSDGIDNLGRQLKAIADFLEEKAAKANNEAVETFGFPSWYGTDAYEVAIGDYELQRIRVCKQLRQLGSLAKDAGSWYVLTEDLVGQRNRGNL